MHPSRERFFSCSSSPRASRSPAPRRPPARTSTPGTTVEAASVSGVDESTLSPTLRDDLQRLVGRKYDPEAAEDVAHRLREELHGYRVTLRVARGERPERVRVIFDAERLAKQPFELKFSPLLYATHDGFSLALVPAFETHHNYISFGFVTNANDRLERERGVVLRYEHRKVGTRVVQLAVEYDYLHPSFQAETETALDDAPLVPGIYRTREVFTPTVSVLPIPELRLTAGATFETLQMQYPSPHDEAAHALTLEARFDKEVRSRAGLRHQVSAWYDLRDATRSLESDFLYTRQWAGADYRLDAGRHHAFGVHVQGGHVGGAAPLFERFSIGSATTLRGWDKLEVAPLGGTRLAYGSLDYHYRPFEVFYDFGTVWDAGQAMDWKHSVGIGFAWRNGVFVSVGVPLRYHDVTPALMFGIRR